MDPPPEPSNPMWEGHVTGGRTTGAIYLCVLPDGSVFDWFWAPPAPPVVTPAQVARQALASVTLPAPVMRRSPTEANSDHGVPYTWVNLWTWFWTDSASWQPLRARAAVGGTWAEVTVTPTRLVYVPGDGEPAVACAGPGRAWRESDGNGVPTAGGCGYRYRHVSATPLTATLAIEWAVTWRGSGGTSGTLPVMRTQVTSTFAVQQIQVVTR
jgi:hypothetical protein